MNSCPFRFFISGEKKQILPDSELYQFPLSGKKPDSSALKTIITIGDYFSAAREFLLQNDFSSLKSGIEIFYQNPVQTGQIRRVSLFLEKHGAFYHPVKVKVIINSGRVFFFVLNGAVSKQGLSLVKDEVRLISGLNKAFAKSYLPRVFASDFIKTDKGDIGFFLGEWFKGYTEFHVSLQKDQYQTIVWESDGSCYYIPKNKTLKIYREISRILTFYYNIETFDQIFSWHHAAGDFIIKDMKDHIMVRLITIRGYGSLSPFCLEKKDYILPSLLFFFLNLTLQIRLDRIDGTGPVVIMGKDITMAAVKGFFDALDEKSGNYNYGNLRTAFIEFYRQFNLKQLIEMMKNIIESNPAEPVEMALIKKNIDYHCKIVHSIIRNM